MPVTSWRLDVSVLFIRPAMRSLPCAADSVSVRVDRAGIRKPCMLTPFAYSSVATSFALSCTRSRHTVGR